MRILGREEDWKNRSEEEKEKESIV